ncbi:MAG: HlyD family efflux transporter periplasmic adaptor subunit [Bacteroidales bacterium]|nr:HlyD family efflux transporter periplasmic adaptor subunit [Bacteroidales bacterium]
MRPITEKVEIKSAITEMVESVFVQEGDQIHIGDTLLTFNTASIDARIHYQLEIEMDKQNQIKDLNHFTKGDKQHDHYYSAKRQQEMILFERQKDEILLRMDNANKKLNRNRLLYQSGVIAEDEYENFLQEKELTIKELKTLTENRLSVWRSDLNELLNSVEEAKGTLRQLYRERRMYTIQTPVNGTLDQFSGIYPSAFLLNGQTIAIISPDSTLVIENYVLPKDIGFLHKGMPVNIQVESFNYNQWGLLRGKITDISSDFMLSDKTAYYKIKCHVDQNYLEMKNGQRGYLKKGMAIQTRFLITKKTLLQLLYQKFDEWANPALRSNHSPVTKQI